MKNFLPILFFCFLFLQNADGQDGVIFLTNPSFEGTPAIGDVGGKLPDGWFDCGFHNETPPDIHLLENNPYGVVTEPYDGYTYLGLVVRENDTWERISQKLSTPLQAGIEYSFSIFLARSLYYLSPTRSSNGKMYNYTAPIQLRVWGGHEYCQRTELLGVTGEIIHSEWKDHEFLLKPTENYRYIVLEAYYRTPTKFPYNGNILLDYASNIVPVDSFELISSNNLLRKQIEYDSTDYITPGSNLTRFEFTEPHMGTEFKIVLYAESDTLAERVSKEAFERVAELEQVFSDYREDSEVSKLSALAGTGEWARASNDLYNVLIFSRQVTDRSEGAFDFTSGALTKLWRRAFRQETIPTEDEINEAKATAGFKYVKLGNGQDVRIIQPGLRLDFGGVAKGYAVDEAMKILKKRGVTRALVDGGGDIAAGSPPPGQSDWKIKRTIYEDGELKEITHPIADQAIATSGDTYRFLEHDGKRYSHIIDPRTGYGITNKKIVSVVAPTCAVADAWATALSVEMVTDAYLRFKKEGVQVFVSGE